MLVSRTNTIFRINHNNTILSFLHLIVYLQPYLEIQQDYFRKSDFIRPAEVCKTFNLPLIFPELTTGTRKL